MGNLFKDKGVVANEKLYGKLALGASFMFILPLLLITYLVFHILPNKDALPDSELYVIAVVASIIASGAVGYLIVRRSIRSLIIIINKAKEIAQGKFHIKLDSANGDELKDLSASFNRITSDLEAKIRELEQSRSLTRELFQKIGHAITSTEKIEALLNIIIQSTKKVLQADACFIAIYEKDSKRLSLKAYSGPQKDLSENVRIPDDKGIVGFVIESRQPMVIKKMGTGQAHGEDKIQYKNILCVPIIEKDKIKGVIGVSDLKNTDRIDTDDLFLVESISNQIATSVENFELNNDIEETYYQTLIALARAVEAKDKYSAKHLERVGEYADMMAEKLGLDEETRKMLKGGAVLHDLGKVGIRDDILNKEGKLTPEEFEIMKTHPIIGENILKPLRTMDKLGDLIRHHHEHYDGTGYPDGLKGEDIPLVSRILTLADVYDALSTDRPYKKAMTPKEAFATLKSYAGTVLDPKLVEIFIESLEQKNPK